MKNKFYKWLQLLCFIVILTFATNVIGQDAALAWSTGEAQNVVMPVLGKLLPASGPYSLPTLKAISIDPKNPFKINFVVDAADQSLSKKLGQEQVNLLIKYFLSFLTIPEEDLWVNLSPYEKDRIITSEFEKTNAGRDMLAQDYILKQLSASLTYPDHELGKEFWKRVYARTQAEFGSTDIPINTFNKVWVVPNGAVVYEKNDLAFISESHLKVLTEQDYLSIAKNTHRFDLFSVQKRRVDQLSSEITREIIIPELEREVNEGKYFAPLRQMYSTLILAIWFKKRLKEDLISQVYVDQKKTAGISLAEKQIKERIYAQYLKAFKKGVYNFVKEDSDQITGEMIPRKYFSGGFSFAMTTPSIHFLLMQKALNIHNKIQALGKKLYKILVNLNPIGVPAASLIAGAMLLGGVHQASAQESYVAQSSIQQDLQKASQVATHLDKVLKDDIKFSHIGSALIHPIVPRLRHASQDLQEFVSPDYVQGQANDSRHMAIHNAAVNLDNELNNDINQWNSREIYQSLTPALEDFENTLKAVQALAEQPVAATPPPLEPAPIVTPVAPVVDQPAPIANQFVQQAPALTTQLVIATPPAVTPAPAVAPTPVTIVTGGDVAPPALPLNTPTVSPGSSPSPQPPAPETTQASTPSSTIAAAPAINTLPAAPAAVNQPLNQLPSDHQFDVTNNVSPIIYPHNLVAPMGGVLVFFDPNHNLHYKQGEPVYYVYDPKLDELIQSLSADLKDQNKVLEDDRIKLSKNEISIDVFAAAQQASADISQKLVDLLIDKMSGVVRAPHDMTIKAKIKTSGTISKNDPILEYKDNQMYSFNFKVPTSQGVNRFSNLTINGTPIESIVNLEWEPDHQDQAYARVNMLVSFASPQNFGVDAQLNYDLLPSENVGKDLNGITGETARNIQINRVLDVVQRSPAAGQARFLVRDGQMVQAGQVLAVVAPESYYENYLATYLSIQDHVFQLSQKQDADGNSTKSQEKQLQLTSELNALTAHLQKQQELIQRLYVRATVSGRVHGLAYGNVSQPQDAILSISPGTGFAGDIQQITSGRSIIFPKDITITNGTPVVIETAQGRLPGYVTAVNRDLENTPESSINLPGSQAIEVMAVGDHSDILHTNLPINVILPSNDQDKQIIADALTRAAQQEGLIAAGSAPPLPDPNLFLQAANPTTAAAPLAVNTGLPLATTPSTANVQTVTLADVDQMLEKNGFITGPLDIDLQISQQKEALAKASEFDLTAGAYMKGGQLYLSGGAAGVFQNMVAGSMMTGNAYGALDPLIATFGGKIVDVVTGKHHQEVALNQELTKIVGLNNEITMLHQKNIGHNLVIDIAGAQAKLEDLNKTLESLMNARTAIIEKQASGLSLKSDRDQIEANIQTTVQNILTLQGQIENSTRNYNLLSGQPTTNLNQLIAANVPLGKDFIGIDQQTATQIQDRLTAADSPNPMMQVAESAGKVKAMGQKLLGLEELPAANLAGIFVSDGNLSSTLVNMSPDEQIFRSSEVGQGANSGLQIKIPIFNTGLKAKEAIAALEKQKTMINQENTKRELVQILEQSISNINNLSKQIEGAKAAYNYAYHAWQLKLAQTPSLYSPDQLSNEVIQKNNRLQELINLETQYLKEEAKLREMNVLGPETLTQNKVIVDTNTVASAVANSVGAGLSSLSVPAPGQNNFGGVLDQVTAAPSSSTLMPGEINYNIAPSDALNTGALMGSDSLRTNTDSFEVIKQQLMNPDADILSQTNALQHFKTDYRSHKDNKKHLDFYPAVKQVILNQTTQPTISWELLKFMGEREDHGLRSYVQIYQEAQAQGNQTAVDLSKMFLKNVFVQYPDFISSLKHDTFKSDGSTMYSLVSPSNAYRVLLSCLLDEGAESIFADHLMGSNLLQINDLYDIYHDLTLTIKSGTLSDTDIIKYNKVRQIIDKWIVQQIAISHAPEAFRPALYNELGGLIIRQTDLDVWARLKSNLDQTTNNLTISAQSLDQMQADLYPPLFQEATNAASNEISLRTKSANNIFPNPPLYLLPDAQTYDVLGCFKILSTDHKIEYINQLKNPTILELTQILKLESNDQQIIIPAVLDRLMESKEGRLAVLAILSDTGVGQDLKDQIVERDWQAKLTEDLESVRDTASNLTYRQGLYDLWLNSDPHPEWALNLRLKTFPVSELVNYNDPRDSKPGEIREDRMEQIAMKEVAIPVLKESQEHYTSKSRAGVNIKNGDEDAELKALEDHALNDQDPRDFEKFYNDQQQTYQSKDTDNKSEGKVKNTVKKMLNYLKWSVDDTVKKYKGNDQSFPKVPIIYYWYAAALAIPVITPLAYAFIWAKLRRIKKRKNPLEMILYISSWLRSFERYDTAPKGVKKSKIIKIESNGSFPIITLPEAKNVFTAEPFKEWLAIVNKLNEKDVSNTEILNSCQQIKALSKSIFDGKAGNSMPYSPHLMHERENWPSRNSAYQRNLFYYIGIANYTLYLLREHLRKNTLNDDQKKIIRNDIEVLMQDLEGTAVNYTRVLHERSTLNTALQRKFEDDHPTEIPRWYLFGYSWFQISRIPLLFEAMIKMSPKRIKALLPDLLKASNKSFGLYTGIVPREQFKIANPEHGEEILEELLHPSNPKKQAIYEEVTPGGPVRLKQGVTERPKLFFGNSWNKIWSMSRTQQMIIDDSEKYMEAMIRQGSTMGSSGTASSSLASRFGQFWRETKYPIELAVILGTILIGVIFNIPWLYFNAPIFLSSFWLIWSLLAYIIPNAVTLSETWVKEEELMLKSYRDDFDKMLGKPDLNTLEAATTNRAQVTPSLSTLVRSSAPVGFIARRGGVDFSSARAGLVFKSVQNGSSSGFNRARFNSIFPTLNSFKGFNFQVIQYKPISNPVAFFLGSSDSGKNLTTGLRTG